MKRIGFIKSNYHHFFIINICVFWMFSLKNTTIRLSYRTRIPATIFFPCAYVLIGDDVESLVPLAANTPVNHLYTGLQKISHCSFCRINTQEKRKSYNTYVFSSREFNQWVKMRMSKVRVQVRHLCPLARHRSTVAILLPGEWRERQEEIALMLRALEHLLTTNWVVA